MKFESVRLLHAQAVPHHYIANQIYQPVDDDHQKNGSFILLFDQQDTNDGAFVASLINTLIREYYRQTTPDRLTAFEQTLVRLNEQIRLFGSRGTESPRLHGLIILCVNDELHITYIGNPIAYLIRDTAFIPLVEAQHPSDEENIGFSVITSGEIHPDDTVVVTTSIQSVQTIKKSISFALGHHPLYEAGRAFARLLKQQSERTCEAIFVNFNTNEQSNTNQVYVDRSLETLAERLAIYQKELARHGHLIWSGAKFTHQKTLPFIQKGISFVRQKFQRSPNKEPIIDRIQPESLKSEILTDELLKPSESSESTELLKHKSESTSTDSPPEFVVKGYWEKNHPEKIIQSTEQSPLINDIAPPSSKRDLLAIIKNLNRRTLYLLVGCIALLFIIIRVVNIVSNKSTPVDNQTNAERDSIITKAQNIAREAEVAQVNDDIPKAITAFLEAEELVSSIEKSKQNETSNALESRLQLALRSLTKTTVLAEGTTIQPLKNFPGRVVITVVGTYVFGNPMTIEKYKDGAVTTISTGVPTGTFIDAVAFDNFNKIAFAVKTDTDTQLYSLTVADDAIKQLVTADGKPWPNLRLLASFETNLYLVGDNMVKAIPKDDRFRVIPYANNASTGTITSIINNGVVFYAIENQKQFFRLAANSPKTAVNLFGVPEKFLPQHYARLMTTRKEGFLSVFDLDGQRILSFSTDGQYRQQYILPKDVEYKECDGSDTTFICATSNKEIKTFTLK